MAEEIKLPKQPKLPEVKFCDRCGNDLSHGAQLIHLPYKKRYITFCNICIWGLWIGFRMDLKDLLRDTNY